jgi:ubiquinone/menaquinone biosynthesis C-methylase UbiE
MLYAVEAAETAKILATLPPDARILSLGTGLGQVEIQLQSSSESARWMAAADLIEPVLREFRHGYPPDAPAPASPLVCDAYHLPFADASFDAVISFGNACVASYKGVAPELSRVIRPGGLVVMDFVNHFSVYQLVRWRNWRRLLLYLGLLKGGEKYHHFGALSLRSFYRDYGLDLQRLQHLMPAPPLRGALTLRQYEVLDSIWPLRRIFSAVLLAVFKKQ